MTTADKKIKFTIEIHVKSENNPPLKQSYVGDWLIYDKISKKKTLKNKAV